MPERTTVVRSDVDCHGVEMPKIEKNQGELPHVSEADSFEEFRQSVQRALIEAEKSGYLCTLLKELPSEEPGKSGVTAPVTQVEPARTTPVAQLADLRKRASWVLANASKDGSLQQALEDQKASYPPPDEATLICVRQSVAATLQQAAEDGRLQQVLSQRQNNQSKNNGSNEDQIEAIRMKLAGVLDEAAKDGSLEKVLAANAESSSGLPVEEEEEEEEEEDEPDLENIRARLQHSLVNSLEDGSIHSLLESAKAKSMSRPPVKKEEEPDVESVRARMQNSLVESFRNGRLDEVIQSELGNPKVKQEEVLAENVPSLSRPPVKEEGPDLESIRARMQHSLLKSFNDGRLDHALQDELGKLEVKQETKEESNNELRNMFTTSSNADFLDTALNDVRDDCNKADSQIVEHETSILNRKIHISGDQEFTSVITMLRARDRRVGELQFLVRDMEQKVIEREQQCQQMKEQLDYVKGTIVHMDMDIEWHKQSLQKAAERCAILEKDHKRSMLELEQHQHKLRHAEFDLTSLAKPSHYDFSTSTPNFRSTCDKNRFNQPRTPRHTVLVPLQQI